MNITKKVLNTTVIVAALGYFVDIYDLQLFNIIGKASLGPQGLNLPTPELINHYYDYVLFNWQMAGMLVGGLLWGIWGDKRGRKSILFGSILLYSIANIANGFVTNITQYEIVRFIAGLGLAGELGAAITLVSETMDKETRGYGTMLIVTLGALGAVVAALLAKTLLNVTIAGFAGWQIAYFIGGGLGLMLLALRVGTFESGMFEATKNDDSVEKGNFFLLFQEKERFVKYIACILMGLPVWYVIGILIKFSDKFALVNAATDWKLDKGYAIMFAYVGLSVGDLLSGLLSQYFKSRRKVVMAYLGSTLVLMCLFLYLKELSATSFYAFCFMLGAATGYWALFVTIASEQFGTNIRSTVTTTVPNFVRGAVIPITLGYKAFDVAFSNSLTAAMLVGAICVGLAFVSIWILPETFGKDLDYHELNQAEK